MSNNPNNKQTIIIGFTGDVMLGRLVDKTIDKKDYAYPWGNMIVYLQKTDLNIANLETTLTKSSKKVPKVFNFKATPDRVEILKKGNINVVSLANNHSLDFGVEGLKETLKTLDNAKILHVGAGMNAHQANASVIVKKGGIKIGIIGFTDNEPEWKAQENKPGINYFKVGDITKVKEDIKNIRNQVDVLIATLHWGPNMRQRPSQEFKNFAHQMIDVGIDIIHGHSAHIFQGIEIYKNKLIMYDTGDFVDDYHVDSTLRNDQSFLFLVTIDKSSRIKKVELIPVLISNMQVNKATDTEKKEIISKMQKLSAEMGTYVTDDGIINL